MSELDPRATNCKAFATDANGMVTGVELAYAPIPSARYACMSAMLRDEYAAQGTTVTSVTVLSADGYPVAERVLKAWPWPGPPWDGTGGSGNANNEFWTGDKFSPPALGPGCIFVADAEGNPISDLIGGLGLPHGRHLSYMLTFKERSSEPTPEPGGTVDLSETNALLRELLAAVKAGFRLPA